MEKESLGLGCPQVVVISEGQEREAARLLASSSPTATPRIARAVRQALCPSVWAAICPSRPAALRGGEIAVMAMDRAGR